MCENKLNIIEINNNTVCVEGVYNIPKNIIHEIRKDADFIRQVARYKREFLKSDTGLDTVTVLNSFFVDVLLYLELNKRCDLSLCSYNDILNFFIYMKDSSKFTSNSIFLAYARIINMYTMWAYNCNLRDDIISVGDITREIDRNTVTEDKEVYTRKEIIDIANNQREDVRIVLFALLEGIKTNDLISITRKEVIENKDNILIIGERLIKVSNGLMQLMKEYANVTTVKAFKRDGSEIERELVNTDYLFRSPKWGRANIGRNVKISNTTLVTIVNEAIKSYGVTTVDIRNYSMYNDIIDDISLEEFNIKYNTKYRTLNQAIRDKKAYNKMVNKRIQENTYKVKCS